MATVFRGRHQLSWEELPFRSGARPADWSPNFIFYKHLRTNFGADDNGGTRFALCRFVLRISINNTPLGTELKLEGKLDQDMVPHVRRAAESIPPGPRRGLDLSDLMFVDRSGERLLRELLDRGFELIACSNYVAELLHARNA